MQLGQSYENWMLHDIIIQGLADKLLQERLILEIIRKKKTLQEIVAVRKTIEHSKVQAAEICYQVTRLNVDAIKYCNVLKIQNKYANKQIQNSQIY